MSNATLRMELRSLVNAIDVQIGVLKEKALAMDIPVSTLQNMDGSWPLIPLFNAKASALLALTNLEKK